MSKVMLICYRNHNKTIRPEIFDALSRRIIPDNISPNPPLVLNDKGLYIAVINPNGALITDNSVCTGYLINEPFNWWQPNAERPDGTFALFRSNSQFIELVSDVCATQTIWYVVTNDMFIASTSQRAVIYLLQDFQPNLQATLWMLSAGNIGPGLSWDKRIKSVKGNSVLLLNRASWVVEEKTQFMEFNPVQASYNEHKTRFMDALSDTLNQARIDFSKWRLSLSGGYDSRCILLMIKNKAGLNCVTWGLKSALGDRKSDAAVARSLADHYGLKHTYYYTDIRNDDFELIIHRLLVAGEGRTDAVSAYMDGCEIWRCFFDSGISGIIRGDVLLCPPHLYTSDAVIARNGMNTLSDYCNVDELRTLINEPQYWPEQFYRRERESFVTWCSRMAYEFRAPTYWAALNEIKNSYVEIMNPLLSSRIVECFFRLPDKLRHHNRLYWDIVRTMSPDIPFAENVAIENINSILRRPSLVAHLFETLDTNEARYLLTDELVDFVLRNMKMNHGTRAIPKRIIPPALKGVAPPRLRKFIHRAITPNVLDPNVLAFRAYIIHKMNSILSQDAQAFKTDSDAESMNLDEKHFVA